ncbi:MAG: DUF1015 domain-containing protein [Verrucomicrobia bacterium]|nr:MAG: DUF1015 domain-containing protein [Verrucomicrobiota bacterium]
MAEIQPFAAVRPQPELAARICAPPYDVMSEAEARERADRDPLSFVRVSRPEVQLPPGSRGDTPEAYAAARRTFRELLAGGALRQDAQASLYFYRQSTSTHSQTGLVALASCADYEAGVIRRHELTRIEKEEDRVRHIEALNAQTGPAFLFHAPDSALREVRDAVTEQPPDIDFTAEDGVRHTAWRVTAPGIVGQIRELFAAMPRLYIADGHHRSAAAVRVWKKKNRAPGYGGFLAVIFPWNELQILPYHRILKDLNGKPPAKVLEEIARRCPPCPSAGKEPPGPGRFLVYVSGQWHGFHYPPADPSAAVVERLDATRLQQHVLGPVFGIDDPRTSDRIDFVGGIHDLTELKARVDSGKAACAIAMAPTPIQALVEVADAGEIMPPKSTWFEPKLRDAMFCHLLPED